MRHTIDSVAFVPGTNDGAMQCSCAWTGLASEFRAHRLADGQSVGKSGAGVHRVSASVWNRHFKQRVVA